MRKEWSEWEFEMGFYYFGALVVSAIIGFFTGFVISKGADIPYDVEPTAAEGVTQGFAVKSVACSSLTSLVLASACLLLILSVVIYLRIVRHWNFDTIFELPIIVLVFVTVCVVPATLDNIFDEFFYQKDAGLFIRGS